MYKLNEKVAGWTATVQNPQSDESDFERAEKLLHGFSVLRARAEESAKESSFTEDETKNYIAMYTTIQMQALEDAVEEWDKSDAEEWESQLPQCLKGIDFGPDFLGGGGGEGNSLVTLSTRQHAERRQLEAAPEAVASEHTRQGFTGGIEGAITRTRDRQTIEVASRPEPPTPLSPEQEATRAAANAGLEMHARWKREEEAAQQEKIRRRQRQEAILKMQRAFIDCGFDAQDALRRATEKIGGL